MTYLATSLKLAKFSVTERTAVDALVDLSLTYGRCDEDDVKLSVNAR